METLSVVPAVEDVAYKVFGVAKGSNYTRNRDAGSIHMNFPILVADENVERIAKVKVDAGDEETLIQLVSKGEDGHEYEYATRVFTDTLTPELLERYLRHGLAEVVYELEFELRAAGRKAISLVLNCKKCASLLP